MRAVDQCLRGLELDEDDYSLNLTLAWSLLRTGDKARVFEAYERFKVTEDLNWFEEDFRIYLGLGETCYKIATYLFRRKYDLLERQVLKDPDTISIHDEAMSECGEGMEEYLEEAITNIHRVLEFDRQRENLEAILTLGQAYAYSGDLDQAVYYIKLGLDLLQKSMSFQQKQLETDTNLTGDGRRFFQEEIRENLHAREGTPRRPGFRLHKAGRGRTGIEPVQSSRGA